MQKTYSRRDALALGRRGFIGDNFPAFVPSPGICAAGGGETANPRPGPHGPRSKHLRSRRGHLPDEAGRLRHGAHCQVDQGRRHLPRHRKRLRRQPAQLWRRLPGTESGSRAAGLPGGPEVPPLREHEARKPLCDHSRRHGSGGRASRRRRQGTGRAEALPYPDVRRRARAISPTAPTST